MIIWFALVIPIIVVPLLLFLYPRKVVWWELVVPITASFLLITICKYGTEEVQTQDTEYWGGWVKQGEYYEAWDEEVSCTHEKYRTEYYKDANGNKQSRKVFDGYEHSYDVDDHSPGWNVQDSNNITFSTSKEEFETLAKRFGNRKFVDMHRDYHLIDGDKYITIWDSSEARLVPTTTIHTYENKVQASDSVFNFQVVDKKDVKRFQLFDYPKIQGNYSCPSILGNAGPTHQKAEREFSLINAELGASKQVRIWILIFKNQPIDAGFAQEQYWKGGNKNELNIAIGVDGNYQVQWGYVFSWTEVEELKVKTRMEIVDQQGKVLDLPKLATWLKPQIQTKWKRKQFADFSYLTINPPGWMVAMTFILTLGLNIGCSTWIIKNEFSEDNKTRMYKRR